LAGNPLFKQLSQSAIEKMSGLMVKLSCKTGDTIFLERDWTWITT